MNNQVYETLQQIAEIAQRLETMEQQNALLLQQQSERYAHNGNQVKGTGVNMTNMNVSIREQNAAQQLQHIQRLVEECQQQLTNF